MKLTPKLPLIRDVKIGTPTAPRDVSGLLERQKQAARALEQTNAAIQSGKLARSGEDVVRKFEELVAGLPQPSSVGVAQARVVAMAVSRDKRPRIPLEGIQVRIRFKQGDPEFATTNSIGLVGFSVASDERGAGYTLEVLAPNGDVLVTQRSPQKIRETPPVHLIEMRRQDELSPHLERAKPLEEAIIRARERAALAGKAVIKALKEQKKLLTKELKEIRDALNRSPNRPGVAPIDSAKPAVPVVTTEPPVVDKTKPPVKTTETSKKPQGSEKSKPTKGGKKTGTATPKKKPPVTKKRVPVTPVKRRTPTKTRKTPSRRGVRKKPK